MDKDTSFFSNEKKIKYFHDIAIDSAKEKAKIIYGENSSYRENFFKIQDEVLNTEILNFERDRLSEIQRSFKTQLSELQMNQKRELLELRKGVGDEIFKKVENKVLEFKHSEKYFPFLCTLIDRCLSISSKKFEIFISKTDDIFIEKLTQYILNESPEAKFVISIDNSLAFGGIRFFDKSEKILINETLDEKINIQKENFSL